MATDMRVAAEEAQFGMSQIKWGIASGTGTQILPRFLPYPIGMEMLLTGNNITARRAYEIGLVNKVVPRAQLMDEALALARTVAAHAPLALQTAKEAAIMGLHSNLHDALKYGYKAERLNGYTEDAREGPRAFSEKRPPKWQGR
jgi:enoyl-CoA hydratase/carnithine racemase